MSSYVQLTWVREFSRRNVWGMFWGHARGLWWGEGIFQWLIFHGGGNFFHENVLQERMSGDFRSACVSSSYAGLQIYV